MKADLNDYAIQRELDRLGEGDSNDEEIAGLRELIDALLEERRQLRNLAEGLRQMNETNNRIIDHLRRRLAEAHGLEPIHLRGGERAA